MGNSCGQDIIISFFLSLFNEIKSDKNKTIQIKHRMSDIASRMQVSLSEELMAILTWLPRLKL